MTIPLESRCLFCELSGKYAITNICANCFNLLERLPHCCKTCALPIPDTSDICGKCQKQPLAIDSVFASCPYEQGMGTLIRRLKDHGDFSSLHLFVQLMLERLSTADFIAPDLIVPIPMHPLKRIERGFNQTDILAGALGKELEIEVLGNALGRFKGQDQRKLKLAKRFTNMRHAFFVRDSSIEGLRIALVDDVMTSGATLHSAATALKSAGALRVDAWVLARTLKD